MNEGPHEAIDQSGHLGAVSAHFQGPRKENTGSGFHIIVENKYVLHHSDVPSRKQREHEFICV